MRLEVAMEGRVLVVHSVDDDLEVLQDVLKMPLSVFSSYLKLPRCMYVVPSIKNSITAQYSTCSAWGVFIFLILICGHSRNGNYDVRLTV